MTRKISEARLRLPQAPVRNSHSARLISIAKMSGQLRSQASSGMSAAPAVK